MLDMTQAPPALAQNPAFTPEHWRSVKRSTRVAHIERVTNLQDGDETWVEIVLKEGAAFRRRKEEIQQLLTANLEVHIETVGGGQNVIVTGLMVPNVGWAFRMSAEDLAQYARELSAFHHQQRLLAERQAHQHLVTLFGQVLTANAELDSDGSRTVVVLDENNGIESALAEIALKAMKGEL